MGRDEVLDAVHRRLLLAATSMNRPHTLIVGPRGSGKTHLLEVVLHRLRADPVCNSKLVIGRVDEDAVGIITYADVLLEIASSLRIDLGVAAGVKASRDVAAIEAAILGHVDGRVLVVVLENLSRLFDALGTSGQRDLRSFVETYGQVVVLASAPLLFRAIGSRNEPWFGSFAIEHLSELTLDEGTELIRRLAVEDDDDYFVAFLDSARGQGRLAALHHLAGGSPRLWMILAGCATVALLDDLVPAVEELLEELVPYYQQRLWDLPGNEARLIRELGTGPPSAPVANIALGCGMEERTAGTALGRLAEAGWVQKEKIPGSDQRKSWYRLREPLLRHHFQYRRADSEPLRLIVDILRVWFDASERRSQLAGARPESVAEQHLLDTFQFDPPSGSAAAYSARDVEHLLAEARRWISDPDAIGTRAAGILIDATMTALRTTSAAGRKVLSDRGASSDVSEVAERLFVLVQRQDPHSSIADRAGELLDAAAGANFQGPEYRILELVAAGWNGMSDRALAVQRLEALVDLDSADRLALAIRHDYGFWLSHVGRYQESLDTFLAVLADRTRVLGADHPDTLTSRNCVSHGLGELGRLDEAFDGHSAVLADRTRVLGADHPDTLRTRQHLGNLLGKLGRHDEALVAYVAIVKAAADLLGPNHPDTLMSRNNVAALLSNVGRHDEAIRAAAAVLDDVVVHLGPEHSLTRTTITTLVAVAVPVLFAGQPLPTVDVSGSGGSEPILATLRYMELARDGSAEAAARLPAELRSLVEGMAGTPAPTLAGP